MTMTSFAKENYRNEELYFGDLRGFCGIGNRGI